MRNYEFEWSFWGFIRIIVPVLVYLMCFVVVFKACSKCCKRRRDDRQRRPVASAPRIGSPRTLARSGSAPAVVIVTIPPETVVVETPNDRAPDYQRLPRPNQDQDPPSYEEATHESYTRQMPYNPGFGR